MRLFWVLLLTTFTVAGNAQGKYKKAKTGSITLHTLATDPEFKKWFVSAYDDYKPDSVVIKTLTTELKDKKIVVVMGTWCSDSQREIPRLFKVLTKANFPESSLTVYGVDAKKKKPASIIRKYSQSPADKIEKVPTIILFDAAGKSLGQIIETPDDTMEKSLHYILKRQYLD